MAWTIEYTDTALKQLRALDKSMARRILDYMDKRVAPSANPRGFGKGLRGMDRVWRYRVGAHRVICMIQDDALLILTVRIGHRKNVYR
uniref:mRNA interferase RelE/StbE n=1 Tax=Candidatus Kentrum sp. MB TaxID=2138164 RepID=A0A450XJ84_9GAMM|nr:MAG: mRNA interferase RelE/StbE [Candidatus Kentron sp. MB]VFK33518.1 MAG: mRNA interferase RelE/StbE [Candidatus Kentron sp. MB]VFK76249.1 MAG: mRNA interferase RelE/StbE [Candidatus Kentron sp. MB]